MTRGKYNSVIAGMGLGLFSLVLPDPAEAQQSASFKLERLSVSAAAGRRTSASYVNSVTVQELLGASGRCPAGSATFLGFWSFLGAGDLPIILRVGKDPIVPGRVELNWSGQAAGFRVYRSTSAGDLSSAQNLLLSTATCAAIDAAAPALAFYLVRAAGGAPAP